jgi:hypothetical protein
MAPVIFRLTLLAVGFALLEQFLPLALVDGATNWIAVAIGLALVFGGSVGFMVPLFESKVERGVENAR